MRRGLWIGALLLAGAAAWGLGERTERVDAGNPVQATLPGAAALPGEAVETLARIRAGGPFEYRQDGSVFENRERLLPAQPRGYYHEYTVETPGSPDRGARRIVSGGDPPVEFFYTDDHSRSFRRLDAGAGR